MNRIKVFTVVFSLALLCLTFQSIASGSDFDKKTIVTINAPVEVPSVGGKKVIGPGTFVFKVMDNGATRNVVQIYNADESKLLATTLALPDYRMQPPDTTIIKFAETAPDAPPAIKEWFYPGDSYGWEFVYPRSRATQLAKANNQNVLSTREKSEEPRTMMKAGVTAVTPQGTDAAVETAATPKP